MNKIFKGADSVNLKDYGPLTRVEAMNAIYGFLTKDEGFLASSAVRQAAARRAARGDGAFDPNNTEHLLEALPEFARAPALKMRQQIDDLSIKILNSDYGTQNVEDNVRDEILGNLGKYMRRKYRVFDDPDSYFKSNEYKKNRREVAQFLRENENTARELYNKVVAEAGELGTPIEAGGQVTNRAINELIDTFVNKYRNSEGFLRKAPNLDRTVQQRMSTMMFRPRKLEEEQLRKLLGEITDSPSEVFTRTVGELAETIAVDNFYGFMRQNRGQILEDGTRIGGDDVIDGTVYDRLSIADKNRYQIMDPAETGGGFGSLRSAPSVDKDGIASPAELRLYTSRPVFNDLTRTTRQFEGLNLIIAPFWWAKVLHKK